MSRIRIAGFALLLVIVAIGPLSGYLFSVHDANARQRDEARDVARNCLTGQRAYDALKTTVETAYKPGSLTVKPATLPLATQELLVELRPLLTASAGNGVEREQQILKKLGPRPHC